MALLEAAGGFQSVHTRHLKVHEDHIGLELLGQADSLFAVHRLAYHVDVAIFCEQPPDETAIHLLIICDQDLHCSITSGLRYFFPAASG